MTNYNNETPMLPPKPQYQNIPGWELYSAELHIEYQQSIEEGLDIEDYKELFQAVAKLPRGEAKKKLGDILYEIVISSKIKDGYNYNEPSDINGIKALRSAPRGIISYDSEALESKIHGAWLGRICGCMLGKTVEGIKTNELIPFLKESGNYPMHRYIYRSDLTEEAYGKYKYPFRERIYADETDGMPVDDDTNYTVLYQEVVEHYGRDFTPADVAEAWINYQGKNAYCTAERVAYCNFVKGFAPPDSAVYQNPYREWIGAQIRGDYFGYINPGNPQLAAEMAWRDACISHVKNGIYGEMLIAAMLAVAAATTDIKEIILGGLGEIPKSSRLHEAVTSVINAYENGAAVEDCLKMIHDQYNEHTSHGWCHTISNAMIVVTSLLYGNGDFGKSICMAVEAGFDTDCNGATVGSILGMANGVSSIPEYWTKPINNTLHTSIFGFDKVRISDRVKLTIKHIEAETQLV